jgi:lipopolysaccharide/colanic/teichoic acid biosynthesis glycosyltransferase
VRLLHTRSHTQRDANAPDFPLSTTLTGKGLLERQDFDNDILIDPRKLAYLHGVKRTLDIAVSLIALTLFVLLLPALALAIRLDSPGPVFYLQTRIGIDRRRRLRSPFATSGERRRILYPGRPFRIFKLRTMYTDAEQFGPRWACTGDARVTRVGTLLRKTRLDEFPQFLNVLRGEMSVIGPRPERLCFIRKFEQEVPHYHDRLTILPGITGLAQVINGYDTDAESVHRKVGLDRKYIRNLSLKTDLRILLMTLNVLASGDGAR